METGDLIIKALEFGSLGIFAVAMFFVMRMIQSGNEIQSKILNGQEASHARLILIMDKELANEKLERTRIEAQLNEMRVEIEKHKEEIRTLKSEVGDKDVKIANERLERTKLESQVNEQKMELERHRTEIKMLRAELEDKDVKIAHMVLQLKEMNELNAKLQKELADVCAERNELKRRLEAVEKQQREDKSAKKRK